MLSKISKNFLLISLLFVLTWLGMVLFRFNSDNGALEKQLLSHLEKAAEGKAAEISSYLDERKNDLTFLASLSNVREDLKKKELSGRTKETLAFLKKSKKYLDLILIDMEGKILWTADNKELLGADLTSAVQEKTKLGEVYKKVKKDFGVGIFDPGYYGRDDKISIFITTPVLVDSLPTGEAGETPGKKDMIGILAAQVDNENIEERVRFDVGLGELGKIYIVNRKGKPMTALYDADGHQITEINTELKQNCFRDYDNYYIVKQNQEVSLVSKSGTSQNYSGRTVFGAHQYILQNGWCVLAEADKENYLASVEFSTKKGEFTRDILIITAALIFILLIWLVINKFFTDTERGSFLFHQRRVNVQCIKDKICPK